MPITTAKELFRQVRTAREAAPEQAPSMAVGDLIPDGDSAISRYLRHALDPELPVDRAVLVTMDGEIKLGGEWRPFYGAECIDADRGFVWSAKVKAGMLPITGYDRLIDGTGGMRWKLAGIVPVMSARGSDVTRSAAGRAALEMFLLPSLGVMPGASWDEEDPTRIVCRLRRFGVETAVNLTIEDDGRLVAVDGDRWGDPADTGTYAVHSFGGTFEEEATFAGRTIPTKFAAGWFAEPDQLGDGEFFRARIRDAQFI